jgi:hypothetical protein
MTQNQIAYAKAALLNGRGSLVRSSVADQSKVLGRTREVR